MSQHEPLHNFDAQQAAQEHGERLSLSSLSVVLDWLTDEISLLESNDLNTGGLLTLAWLKWRRRELNTQLLALSEQSEKLP
jgi:hypothetical protein